MTTAPGADLRIVGAGLRPLMHLTLEGLDALTSCRVIFSSLAPSAGGERLAKHGLVISSLWPMYEAGRPRRETYRAAADRVLESALDAAPVGYLTQGNPLVFDSVVQHLLSASEALGVSLQIVPGVSSIDTVLCAIGYDAGAGLQIHDATAVLEQRVCLDPACAALILQPSVVATELAVLDEPALARRREALSPLVRYLRGFYGSEHRCTLVRSPTEWDPAGAQHSASLADLVDLPSGALADSSLFIPPAQSASSRSS